MIGLNSSMASLFIASQIYVLGCSTIDPNCATCDVNTATCNSCFRGYILDNNICKRDCSKFDEQCDTCDDTQCLTCKTGFEIDANHKCVAPPAPQCDGTDEKSCTDVAKCSWVDGKCQPKAEL